MNQEPGGVALTQEFWRTENRRYVAPHFRLYKIAKAVATLSRGRHCDLLDVGCGPAALARLLDSNVNYFGVDISIQEPASSLFEADVLQGGLSALGRTFDIVVASGLFEYVGKAEARLLADIHQVLDSSGAFVVSYTNFSHIHRVVTPLYNNIRTIAAFRKNLGAVFDVRRSYPVSYNWRGTAPRRPLLTKIQMHLELDVPLAGRFLGVEYLFVCSPKR